MNSDARVRQAQRRQVVRELHGRDEGKQPEGEEVAQQEPPVGVQPLVRPRERHRVHQNRREDARERREHQDGKDLERTRLAAVLGQRHHALRRVLALRLHLKRVEDAPPPTSHASSFDHRRGRRCCLLLLISMPRTLLRCGDIPYTLYKLLIDLGRSGLVQPGTANFKVQQTYLT